MLALAVRSRRLLTLSLSLGFGLANLPSLAHATFSMESVSQNSTPQKSSGASSIKKLKVVNKVTKVDVLPTLLDSRLYQGQPMGVDLEDLVKYSPRRVYDALTLARAVRARDSRIFQDGETLAGEVTLEAAPIISGDTAVYQIVALIQPAPDGADEVFRKLSVTVAGLPRTITSVQVLADVPISSTDFSISVGLVSRVAVLEDINKGLLLTFPIGVGGLDMGIIGKANHILTPMFHGATLRRSTVLPHLGPAEHQPAYYREEPYMGITNQKGRLSDVAFHITILTDNDWATAGPQYLIRGFDSHGCMRLRLKDLKEFFDIVENGDSEALPVDVDYFVSNRDTAGQPDHTWNPINAVSPYPLREDGYMQVKNFAAPGAPPMAQRDTSDPTDPHPLIILENVSGTPYFTQLDGFDGNDSEILSQFEAAIAKRSIPSASHAPQILPVSASPLPTLTISPPQ
jgi:hypothetical protein